MDMSLQQDLILCKNKHLFNQTDVVKITLMLIILSSDPKQCG